MDLFIGVGLLVEIIWQRFDDVVANACRPNFVSHIHNSVIVAAHHERNRINWSAAFVFHLNIHMRSGKQFLECVDEIICNDL